ncbi:XRE family transcriptional regulator [Rhodococcus sp. NPDC057297]|uniref:XRE family transcriptional regulator n=1 Tax=Rhodococcus sp. NPDC057297 TaxID=3346090 RepID=UPI0036295F76
MVGDAPNGERLLTLQHLRGLTQGELATRLGVSGGFLSHVAKGTKAFPASLVQSASSEFRVPQSFFYVRLAPEDVGPVTFKKTSTAKVRDEKRVVALYTEASRLFRHVSDRSGYHVSKLPSVESHEDPEDVAATVRSIAGSPPDAPITNTTRLIERLGVGVVHTLDPDGHADNAHAGASRPSRISTRPLIALACQLPGAEQRFTLAHELFHVMADRDLDRGLTLIRDPRELRANRFAGALLLPPGIAKKQVSETLTLHGYLKIKAEFGLSVGAIIHRAHDLGLISDHRAKMLYIQWSSAGWRRNGEPVPVPQERPLLLDQALQRAYGRSYAAKASHDTGVSADLISSWIEKSSEVQAGVAEVINLSDRRN